MAKFAAILLVSVFSFCAQAAHPENYNKFLWGPRLEKGRAFESYGIDFQTKKLYSFKNLVGTEMHHCLVLGLNHFDVENQYVAADGKFEGSSAFAVNLGIRAYNAHNTIYGEVAAVHVMPESDLSKDSSTGGLFRFGYMIPHVARDKNDEVNMFDVSFTYRIGLGKADKLASEPDLFNGMGIGIAYLL